MNSTFYEFIRVKRAEAQKYAVRYDSQKH